MPPTTTAASGESEVRRKSKEVSAASGESEVRRKSKDESEPKKRIPKSTSGDLSDISGEVKAEKPRHRKSHDKSAEEGGPALDAEAAAEAALAKAERKKKRAEARERDGLLAASSDKPQSSSDKVDQAAASLSSVSLNDSAPAAEPSSKKAELFAAVGELDARISTALKEEPKRAALPATKDIVPPKAEVKVEVTKVEVAKAPEPVAEPAKPVEEPVKETPRRTSRVEEAKTDTKAVQETKTETKPVEPVQETKPAEAAVEAAPAAAEAMSQDDLLRLEIEREREERRRERERRRSGASGSTTSTPEPNSFIGFSNAQRRTSSPAAAPSRSFASPAAVSLAPTSAAKSVSAPEPTLTTAAKSAYESRLSSSPAPERRASSAETRASSSPAPERRVSAAESRVTSSPEPERRASAAESRVTSSPAPERRVSAAAAAEPVVTPAPAPVEPVVTPAPASAEPVVAPSPAPVAASSEPAPTTPLTLGKASPRLGSMSAAMKRSIPRLDVSPLSSGGSAEEPSTPTTPGSEERRRHRRTRSTAAADLPQIARSPSIGNAKDSCFQCRKRVYPTERLEVEGTLFHKLGCFKCHKCGSTLRAGQYGIHSGTFYCLLHHRAALRADRANDEQQTAGLESGSGRAASPTRSLRSDVTGTSTPPAQRRRESALEETESRPRSSSALYGGSSRVSETPSPPSKLAAEPSNPRLASVVSQSMLRSRTPEPSRSVHSPLPFGGSRSKTPEPKSTPAIRFTSVAVTVSTKLSGKQALLEWAKRCGEGYPNVEVTNFNVSFRDGLAFCAIIHRYRPNMLDFKALSPTNRHENLRLAFAAADQLVRDELPILNIY